MKRYYWDRTHYNTLEKHYCQVVAPGNFVCLFGRQVIFVQTLLKYIRNAFRMPSKLDPNKKLVFIYDDIHSLVITKMLTCDETHVDIHL